MGRKIELDHWFINGNRLEISLFNCYVSIVQTEELKYLLTKIDGFMRNTTMTFDSLEEAIEYTEEVISKEKPKVLSKRK